MRKAKILDIDVYHPSKSINNEPFINHFNSMGKDIVSFLKHMGRESRYIVEDGEENSLTMAIMASERVLEKAGLTGKDIDMIVYSSQTPEYTVPTNAIIIHNSIGADNNVITFDSNANCGGMLVAIDHASKYINSSDSVNRVLIVGSDYNRLLANPKDEITFPNFGDGAVAVILEATNEDAGFFDAIYYTDSSVNDKIRFPEQGLSHMLLNNTNNNYMKWLPIDTNISMKPAYKSMRDILERNNLTKEDVAAFCLSQFSIAAIDGVGKELDIDQSKLIYIGDEYGYTGTSSPLLAFYHALKEQKVKRGDYVLFWTVGGGFQNITTLLKY